MPLPISLITSLKQGVGGIVVEAPLAAHAYALVDAVRGTSKPLVHVLPSDKELAATALLCEFLAPDCLVLQLPAWDTLPYDRVSPSHAITATRLNTLSQLVASKKEHLRHAISTASGIRGQNHGKCRGTDIIQNHIFDMLAFVVPAIK